MNPRTLLASDPPQAMTEMLRAITLLGVRAVRGTEGSFLRYVEAEDVLEFVLTVGSDASDRVLRGQRVPMGAGVTGLSARSMQPCVGHPTFLTIDQAREPRIDRAEGGAPACVVAAPVISEDSLLGMLTVVSWDASMEFTRADIEAMGLAAALAGVLLQQAAQLAELDGELAPDPSTAETLAAVRQLLDAGPRASETLRCVVRALRGGFA